MFISEKEASSRLRSEKNLFRSNFEQEDSETSNSLRSPSSSNPEQESELPVPADFSEDELPSEQNQQDQLAIVESHFRGRNNGNTNIPQFMKVVMGVASQFSTQKEVAETFGVSLPIVNAAANGNKISNNVREKDEKLAKKIDAIIEPIQHLAAEKLMASLGMLTDERINNSKARDISGIAKDMASIMEKTSPRVERESGTKILIYAPQQHNESFYDTVKLPSNSL